MLIREFVGWAKARGTVSRSGQDRRARRAHAWARSAPLRFAHPTESTESRLGGRRAAHDGGGGRIVAGDVGAVAAARRIALVDGAVAGAGARAAWGAVVGEHEVGDARRDLGAEARAVEHAVVADVGLHPVRRAVGRDVDAQA